MKLMDQLVRITKKDWSVLRDLYLPHRSKSYIGYCTIDNYIRWLERDPEIKNIYIYCLNDDWSDGTFVVIDRYHAFVDTLNESNENVVRLLKLLDYSKGYRFISVRSQIQPAILKVIEKRNLKLEYDEHDTAILYHLPAEEALKLDVRVPDNIKLCQLSDADAEKANAVWPHRHTGSSGLFRHLAKFNANIGAFTNDGELVAWVLGYPSGLLCAFQTDNSYYGLGLGTLVSKVILKQIGKMGQDGYAGVLEKNHASRALFERLGFRAIDTVHWYATRHDWPDE